MLLEEEANKLREYAYKIMELARTSASSLAFVSLLEIVELQVAV